MKILFLGSDAISTYTLKALLKRQPTLRSQLSVLCPAATKNKKSPLGKFH